MVGKWTNVSLSGFWKIKWSRFASFSFLTLLLPMGQTSICHLHVLACLLVECRLNIYELIICFVTLGFVYISSVQLIFIKISIKKNVLCFCLSSGSSTKLVLNAVSTGAHILKGKIYQNHMVDLQVSNGKLYRRATRILQVPRFTRLASHNEVPFCLFQ